MPAWSATPSSVADAIALGDCGTALDQMASLPEPEDRRTAQARALARGFCLLRERAPEAALEALDSEGDLAGYAMLIRAQALAALGRPAEALAVLEGEPPPGRAGRQVLLWRGRLLWERGDEQGAQLLRSLDETELASEARYWLAEGYGVQGRTKEMIEALRNAYADARPGGWDTRAAERLSQLGIAASDLESSEGRALLQRRLASLHDYRRTEDALALAKEVYDGVTPSDRIGFVELGHVHYSARDYEGALRAWENAYGAPAEARGNAKELFEYALGHARTGDYDTAAVVYRRVIGIHPKTSQADFASFKLGYMEYDRAKCIDAIPLFEAHREAYPASKHLDEALWFEARCHWKAGARKKSIALLETLQAKRPRSSLAPGGAYWRARSQGLDGDAEGERKGLQNVLERWPGSGYAWFAAQRLGKRFPVRADVEPPAYPEAWASKSEVQRAQALLAVGLRSFAKDELDTLPKPTERDAAMAVAHDRIRAGDYRRASRLACRYAAKPWKPGDTVAQQACLPRPERAIVERYASEAGLDPAVAYAVMWAESALDPSVTSAVGARGLMQLMPEVGATLHERLFAGRGYDADDLYLAPYNAALGTQELVDRSQTLRETLDPNSAPAMIASYNAGEEVVRRWLDEAGAGRPSFDEWSEDISYTETRRYVKGVLGYVMRYHWLYGEE
ncbi:MAG: transglycosylase SLT domain-containing protein [Myxococcota bacterium]